MDHRRNRSAERHMCAVLALWATALCVAAAMPSVVYADSEELTSFQSGDWERAQQHAMDRDDGQSLRLRARFSLWAGDDDDALRFARAALDVADSDRQTRRADVEVARLQWLFGERDEAIARLRRLLEQAPGDAEVRFELGHMLIDDGAISEGRAVLEGLARRYNDGHIDSAPELVWLGRAMMAADRPRDANRALSRAIGKNPDYIEAHLRLGDLMLRWHNTAEAEGAYREVLDRHSDHPEALAGMAMIELQQSGRFAESNSLIERAARQYPGHPRVGRVRSELLLSQGRWEAGRQHAAGLVERFPEDSEGLSLLAAAAYLNADDREFERLATRFDERRSNRPHLLATTAEFAARNNRHRASVELYDRALERDDSYAPALQGLGVALTRIGDEARGVSVLERAFRADRYHVPVYNTLELYERGLDDYVTADVDGFRLRAHASEFDVLRDVAEPLVKRARGVFAERYGVELDSLTLEVFTDSQDFSVRSVGLPHIDPHGVCFGPVVLTRSPDDGDFNWEMVVWHELAHSYHMELSDERVPVWFTEGLAEYETRLADPSWTRFHDLDVARRVMHDRLWSLADLNEVFMTGRGAEVGHAYQVAMLFMAFLDENYGLDVAVDMVEYFADEPDVKAVFEHLLEIDMDAVDRQFRQWIADRYSGLMRQELVDVVRLQAMVAGEDVEHANAGEAAGYRAMAAAMSGDEQAARIQLQNAERRGESTASVAILRTLTLESLGDIDAGLDAARQAFDDGVEGYDLRLSASRMAADAGRSEEAYIHASSAVELAGQDTDGWRQLQLRAASAGESDAEQRARNAIFERNPHDASLARRQTDLFERRGDYHEAYRAAQRWTQIEVLDARSHIALGGASARRGNVDVARRAFDRGAMAAPARRDQIVQQAIDAFDDTGAADVADHYRRRLQRDGADEP